MTPRLDRRRCRNQLEQDLEGPVVRQARDGRPSGRSLLDQDPPDDRQRADDVAHLDFDRARARLVVIAELRPGPRDGAVRPEGQLERFFEALGAIKWRELEG